MPFLVLEKQAAIVTGAATGIGEAIAQRLACAGATVAVADVDFEMASRVAGSISASSGLGAFPLALDVTNPASVDRAVAETISRTGRIDILVNNAGIAGPIAPLWELRFEEWRRVFSVNVDGAFHLSRAAIAHMRERQYGRIVNITSIAGKEGNARMTALSASKAAVIGFTKALAKEVATEGICVNAVAPSVVRTKVLDQLTPSQIELMVEKIPMRRVASPEEIAAVVHFLASPDASFVTGQCYDASGGRATY